MAFTYFTTPEPGNCPKCRRKRTRLRSNCGMGRNGAPCPSHPEFLICWHCHTAAQAITSADTGKATT